MQLTTNALNKIKPRGQYYVMSEGVNEESSLEFLCVLNREPNETKETIREKIHGAGGTLRTLLGNICSVLILGRDLQQFLDLPIVRRIDFGDDLYPEGT